MIFTLLRPKPSKLRSISLMLLLVLALAACGNKNSVASRSQSATTSCETAPVQERNDMSEDKYEVAKSDAEWREELTPEQYQITRLKGTERAFTGKYYNHKGEGQYRCVCCDAVLFTSTEKYDSGSGWPSFWAPAADAVIAEERDTSLGMERIEVTCGRCGAHLGHVFEDGPQDKTGLRYCVNSVSLEFQPASQDSGGSDP